jgi:NitT/TauT family transport system permease protein
MADSTASRIQKFNTALGNLSTGIGSLAVLILLWQIAVSSFEIPKYVLPTPIGVWKALVSGLLEDPWSPASFWYQLNSTMQATVLGFLIGAFLGVLIAALMAEFRLVQKFIFPYVVGFQSLPKVAIAPLYVIWFGYQLEPKIAMSATLTLFPVLLNSLQGFTSTEHDRLELLAALDANRWQTFWYMKFPSALPFVFAGLNLGVVYSLLGTIVAEFIGAQRGMGVIITQLQMVADTAGVFAALLVLAATGYILISIMRLLQARYVFWSSIKREIDAA